MKETKFKNTEIGEIPEDWEDVINPQLYREEIMSLCEGHNDTIRLKITWDDEYQNNRSVSLTVPF